MKTYLIYQTEDFVQDPYFRKWALGTLPPGDRFWETWQATHPEQYETLETAKSMVIALRIQGIEIEPQEMQDAIDRVLHDTEMKLDGTRHHIRWLPVAASVLLILGLAFWLLRGRDVSPGPTGGAQRPVAILEREEVNNSPGLRTIVLPDSSKVTLESRSTLRISQRFGKEMREVYLTGGAFFDVVRDPERPFMVYSGKVATKVLGTSFRISAYDSDEKVSIGVRTGKVTVFKRGRQADPMLLEEVVLTPNQQAVFVKKEDKFVKTLVEEPAVLDLPRARKSLDFTETPIPTVLNALEQVYGVRMVYDTEKLKECNMTGSLNEGTLYEKLGIVCETIQANYKVADGQVVIDGKGCK